MSFVDDCCGVAHPHIGIEFRQSLQQSTAVPTGNPDPARRPRWVARVSKRTSYWCFRYSGNPRYSSLGWIWLTADYAPVSQGGRLRAAYLSQLIDGGERQLDPISLVVRRHHDRHESLANMALSVWDQSWPGLRSPQPPGARHGQRERAQHQPTVTGETRVRGRQRKTGDCSCVLNLWSLFLSGKGDASY